MKYDPLELEILNWLSSDIGPKPNITRFNVQFRDYRSSDVLMKTINGLTIEELVQFEHSSDSHDENSHIRITKEGMLALRKSRSKPKPKNKGKINTINADTVYVTNGDSNIKRDDLQIPDRIFGPYYHKYPVTVLSNKRFFDRIFFGNHKKGEILSKNKLSLDLMILSWLKSHPENHAIPESLHKELNLIYVSSDEEFRHVLRNLYTEGLIKAIDSWNGGIIRIIGITSSGLKFLREQTENKDKGYSMKIKTINAQNSFVAETNYGNVTMAATDNHSYAEIEKVLAEVKQLPLKETDAALIASLEDDIQEAKNGNTKRLKRMTSFYENCLAGYAVAYTAPIFTSLAAMITGLPLQ